MLRKSEWKIKWALYREQLVDQARGLRRRWLPEEVAIAGSFNTTNVGDLAIGVALRSAIHSQLVAKAALYGLHHTDFRGHKLVLQGGGDSVHDNSSRIPFLSLPQ